MFSLSDKVLNRDDLSRDLANDKAGAMVVFEGWVRDHNQGKKVLSLEYQIYEELALKEGERILQEAKEKFNLHQVRSVHRYGHLKLGEMAIWIGATASHRDDAFKATRFIIDEIKHRLPVWKKEHYRDQKAEWVFCRHHHHHVHFEEADFYQKQNKVVDQNKLKKSSVLVVGAGGLGCPALVNLVAAGIGEITVADFDKISLSNIHRQHLYSPNLVGEEKSIIAAKKLQELNPFIKVKPLSIRVDSSNAESLISFYDLILDCTDSMQTKYLLHDACFKGKKPLVSASIYKSEGQIRTFIPGQGCLRCFITETPDDSLLGNCNDFGVLGVTTSVMGSLQASEAIEFLQNGFNASCESTFFFDLKTLNLMKVKNSKKDDCQVCQGKVELASEPWEVDLHDFDCRDIDLVDIRQLKDQDLTNYQASEKKIIFYCHRGVRSKKLVSQLRNQGHDHFYSLKGGACSL